jgi:hypothetical protein
MADGLTRRNLIKSAAAAGVGVAAWSAPSIRTLGTTPAFAAVCTTPIQYFTSGERNVDCGQCSDGNDKFLSYHSPITDFFIGQTGSGTPAAGFSLTITDSSPCSDHPVAATLVTNPDDLVCEICVILNPAVVPTECSAPTSNNSVFIPQTDSLTPTECSGTKYSVQLRCVPAGSCFPE